MSIDLSTLEKTYHIIPASGAQDLATYEVLRLLDNEIATGVQALWDEMGQSIVAFLFSRGQFTADEARAWVDEIETAGVNFSIGLSLYDTPLEDILGILDAAVWTASDEGHFVRPDGKAFYPWLYQVYAEFVIVRASGRWYKVPYTLDENNNVTLGEPVEVKMAYTEVEPQAAAGMAMAVPGNGKTIHLRLRNLGPAKLKALSATPDDLVWKEIFAVSTTYHPWSDEPLVVEQWMIDGITAAFEGGAFPFVAVTAHDHADDTWGIVPADATVGQVKKLVKDGGRLYGGLSIKDPTIHQALGDTIVDCSVYLWFDFNDNRGRHWDIGLVHLLLTNYAQLGGLLSEFGAKPATIAASIGGVNVRYQIYEEAIMSSKPAGFEKTQATPPAAPPIQVELTAEQKAFLDAATAAGFDAASVEAFQAQRRAFYKRLREVEIGAVVAALEGKAQHAGVTQVEGYTHFPVVVQAVKDALAALPGTLGLDIGEQGETGIDAAILGIANALPKEARFKLDGPPLPDRSEGAGENTLKTARPAGAGGDVTISAQAVDALLKALDRSPGAGATEAGAD